MQSRDHSHAQPSDQQSVPFAPIIKAWPTFHQDIVSAICPAQERVGISQVRMALHHEFQKHDQVLAMRALEHTETHSGLMVFEAYC